MITALCYFWYLLWNVEEGNRAFFAGLSTIEIGVELFFFIPTVFIFLVEWLSRRSPNER